MSTTTEETAEKKAVAEKTSRSVKVDVSTTSSLWTIGFMFTLGYLDAFPPKTTGLWETFLAFLVLLIFWPYILGLEFHH